MLPETAGVVDEEDGGREQTEPALVAGPMEDSPEVCQDLY